MTFSRCVTEVQDERNHIKNKTTCFTHENPFVKIFLLLYFTFTFFFEKQFKKYCLKLSRISNPQRATKIRHHAISPECLVGMVRASGARLVCSLGQWKETASGSLPSFQLERDGAYGHQCLPFLITSYQSHRHNI